MKWEVALLLIHSCGGKNGKMYKMTVFRLSPEILPNQGLKLKNRSKTLHAVVHWLSNKPGNMSVRRQVWSEWCAYFVAMKKRRLTKYCYIKNSISSHISSLLSVLLFTCSTCLLLSFGLNLISSLKMIISS